MRDVLDSAAERVETELADHPAVERDVRRTIGRSYIALGLFDEGRPLYEQAYKIRSALLDENDFSLITSLNNLARERYTAGEYAEAQELQQEAS